MTAHRDGPTRIARLRQSGATKLAFPRLARHRLDAILINTAGGITGGDQFTLDAEIGENAALTLTTQAAERAYRAQPGEVADVRTSLTVASGARSLWLPQELILFDGCALRRRLDIALAADARLLMVEPVVFGRAAMGETLRDVRFEDRIHITRAGAPLYIDGTSLRGDASRALSRPSSAAGAGAMASLVLVDPSAAVCLPRIRAGLPATAGASLLAEDTLVMRQLAPDALALRRALVPILDLLTDNSLPMTWRL